VIKNVSTISSGQTLTYDATIVDVHGKSRIYSSNTITIANTPVFWYAYLSEVGVYATNLANALSSYGDANDDGNIDTNYPFDNFAKGEMGNNILDSTALIGVGRYSFLITSGSILQGSRETPLLTNINHNTGSNSNSGVLIVFPSSSNFTLPNTIGNTVGSSTVGEYLLYGDRVGTGINDGPQSAFVRYFNMSGSTTYPNSSATRFGVIFTQGDASTDVEYFFMASSGSAPTSTQ
jgi:hypothetical protein